MGRIIFTHTYDSIISVENLLGAWREFVRGKRKRKDVQEFERNLMANVLSLQSDLAAKTYRHSAYEAFTVADPKPRNIHKASVRDRLLHRALYRQLYPFFDKTFISDSFSCRKGKGMHRAMNRFQEYAYKASRNHTETIWVLKCDVRKFFASVDQKILSEILRQYIYDTEVFGLIQKVLESFHSVTLGKGLPLGNLTSQLSANVYMNEFDQFVKHRLKAKFYIRYADDFVLLSGDRDFLEMCLLRIGYFLEARLKLSLHPDKVFTKTFASGADFIGWVHFPDHRVPRTSTKRRMFKRLAQNPKPESVASYIGMLRHGNAWKLSNSLNKFAKVLK